MKSKRMTEGTVEIAKTGGEGKIGMIKIIQMQISEATSRDNGPYYNNSKVPEETASAVFQKVHESQKAVPGLKMFVGGCQEANN